MAININTGNLTTPQYNTYKIEKFNGVDYTTTPTKVDGTRAIDMSNYLPMGTSLVKRYGIEKIKELDEDVLIEKSIHYDGIRYDVQVTKPKEDREDRIIKQEVRILDFEQDTLISMIKIPYVESEVYLDCMVLEEKLFILTCKKYFVYDFEAFEVVEINTGYEYEETINDMKFTRFKEVAYIPTLLLALGNDNSSIKSRVYEPINLLSNRFKVKLYYDLSKMGTQRFSVGNYYNKAIKVVSFGGKTEANPSGQFNLPYYPTNAQTSVPIAFSLRYNDNAVNYYGENYVFELTSNTTSTQYTIEGLLEIEVVFEMQDFNPSLVTHATKMIRYGVQQGDTLFFGCNSSYPNVDVHTSIIENTEESWKKYTYVPDDSYQAFGDSNTAVIGYGILNNGHMIIVKESEGNEPNVYTRSGQYYSETISYDLVSLGSDGKETTKTLSFPYTDIRYPTFITGCFVNATKDSKMVYYDNKVFISNQDGVYNIVLNDSTATQTYSAYEFSYSIRANLSRDISHSDAFVYDNRLFIYRKDINGKYRLYVADKSRYLYHNDKLQYEWWVLDGFGDESVFSVDNGEMYFTNKYGKYKYGKTDFIDTESYSLDVVKVNNEIQSTQAFVDTDNNMIVFSPGSRIFEQINNSIDKKLAYETLIKETRIKFEIPNMIKFGAILIDSNATKDNMLDYTCKDEQEQEEILNLLGKDVPIILGQYKYVCDSYTVDGLKVSMALPQEMQNTSHQANYRTLLAFDIAEVKNDMYYEIDNMYATQTENGVTSHYDVRYCVFDGEKWIYTGEDGKDFIELQSALFNNVTLKLGGVRYYIDITDILGEVGIYTNRNIDSKWISSYISCDRLDYLKTASNIYFVPDPIRGGYTHVGFRTSKKEIEYMTYAVGDTFSFDDVDFSDFNFGLTEFGRTYSSKKKIKNFSYIQLKLYSNDNKDSSVTAIAFRYKYSKQNKGVR